MNYINNLKHSVNEMRKLEDQLWSYTDYDDELQDAVNPFLTEIQKIQELIKILDQAIDEAEGR